MSEVAAAEKMSEVAAAEKMSEEEKIQLLQKLQKELDDLEVEQDKLFEAKGKLNIDDSDFKTKAREISMNITKVKDRMIELPKIIDAILATLKKVEKPVEKPVDPEAQAKANTMAMFQSQLPKLGGKTRRRKQKKNKKVAKRKTGKKSRGCR